MPSDVAFDEAIRVAALGVAGYLLGSIPVAWLIARIVLGIDLRTVGSGNVGVMNTAISVHRWAGLVVLLAEVAKGVLAVLMARQVGGGDVGVGVSALAAFVGTRWPVWLGFHGGRGNTAGAASVALIAPLAIVLLGVLWLAVKFATHDNFLATRTMIVAGAPILGLVTMSWWWAVVGAAYAALFLTTHRPETDDHLLLKRYYPTVAAFLTSKPRRAHTSGRADRRD